MKKGGDTPDLISIARNPRKIKQTGNTNFALSVVSEFSGQSDPGVLFGGGTDDKEGPGIFRQLQIFWSRTQGYRM